MFLQERKLETTAGEESGGASKELKGTLLRGEGASIRLMAAFYRCRPLIGPGNAKKEGEREKGKKGREEESRAFHLQQRRMAARYELRISKRPKRKKKKREK